ncbi:hypothetical protein ACLB1E_23290 [Escherichia coli]
MELIAGALTSHKDW